jgi:hypothetical protein
MQAVTMGALLVALAGAALPQAPVTETPDAPKALEAQEGKGRPSVLPRPVIPDAPAPRKEGPGIDCTMLIMQADPKIDRGFSVPLKGEVDPKMVVPSACRK